jgi:hypothetical protein
LTQIKDSTSKAAMTPLEHGLYLRCALLRLLVPDWQRERETAVSIGNGRWNNSEL